MRRCRLSLLAAPILLNPLPPKNRGLYRVPQNQKWVLERYGAFWGVLDAGPHFVTPLMDDIRFAVTTSEVVVPMVVRDCMTQDGLLVNIEVDVVVRISDGVSDIKQLCYGNTDTPSLFLSLSSGRITRTARMYTYEELSGAPFQSNVLRALVSPLNPSQFAEADPSEWEGVGPKEDVNPATPTAETATPEAPMKETKPEAKGEAKSETAKEDAKPAADVSDESTTASKSEDKSKADGDKLPEGDKPEGEKKGRGAFLTAQTGLVPVGFQLRQLQLTPEARYQLSIRAHEHHVQETSRYQSGQDAIWKEAAAQQQKQSDAQRDQIFAKKIEEDTHVQLEWAKSTAEAIKVLSSAIRAERTLDGIKAPAVDSAQLAVQLLVNSK